MAIDSSPSNSPGGTVVRPRIVRILLVDDEAKLRDSLAEGLRLEEWEVETAANGTEALRLIDSGHFDLLVLDWMLPDIDGIDVLRAVRTRDYQLPVLMVTARNAHSDQAVAFANGATDYVTKPFGFSEFLNRCRALLAPVVPAGGRLVCGNVELDPRSLVLRTNGKAISLSETETLLLEFLLRHPRDVATMDALARLAGGKPVLFPPLRAAVEDQLKQLMQKIRVAGGCPLIKIVQGVGYGIDEAACGATRAPR